MQIEKKMRAKFGSMSAKVQVGKQGVIRSIIEEIDTQLRKNELVKIKFSSISLKDKDKKKLFQDVADKTNSKIIHSIGFALLLYRKK